MIRFFPEFISHDWHSLFKLKKTQNSSSPAINNLLHNQKKPPSSWLQEWNCYWMLRDKSDGKEKSYVGDKLYFEFDEEQSIVIGTLD